MKKYVTTEDTIVAALRARDRVARMSDPAAAVLRSLANTLDLAADLATDDETKRKIRALAADALAAANAKDQGRKR